MKFAKTIVYIICVVAILFVGYKLRLHDYNKIPFPGESTDEYSNSWMGLSLIEFGYPVGVSALAGYSSDYYEYVNVDRIFQTVASTGPLLFHKPWFDHPPMMGLFTGGYAYLKGARVFEDTTTAIIRKPMVLLGTITLYLVMLLGYFVAGPAVALLAGAIYATSPLLVINSRMIQAENGYLPLLLCTLICLHLFEKYKKEPWLWVAGTFSALCVTFKIPGLVTTLIGVVVLMTQEDKSVIHKIKESLIFFFISILGLISFFVYGAAFDWKEFVNILSSNSSRVYGIGFNAINDLLIHTKITGGKMLTDGWPLLGWLSLWTLFTDKRSKLFRYILLPVLVYLVVYLLAGSEPYGWYRIPFLPFLYISLSIFLVDALQNGNKILMAVYAIMIPIGINLQKVTDVEGGYNYSNLWKLGIMLVTVIVFSSLIFKNGKFKMLAIVTRVILIALVLLAIYTNIQYNNMITVDYWYKAS